MVQIADMAAFVAVVETASFTEAARRMTTTKSVISRRISDLELELGASLLDRSSRSVRPTEVGAVYYAKCVRILEAIGSANDFVSSYNSLITGRLRVALSCELNSPHVTTLLDAFSKRYPDVTLELEFSNGARPLSDTQFDVFIRPGQLNDSLYVERPLTNHRYFLCASREYLSARGVPSSPDDLREHDGLFAFSSGRRSAWPLMVDQEIQEYRARERLRSSSDQHLVEAACAGLGICRAPSVLVETHVVSGALQAILVGMSPPPESVYFAYPRSRKSSQKVQALFSFLSEQITTPAEWDVRIDQALAQYPAGR